MVKVHDHLTHEVLFYNSRQQLLATVTPFVRAGLNGDERVVLVGPPATATLLRAELGHHRHIGYLDAQAIYTTPVETLASYQGIVEDCLASGAARVRVVGDAALHADPEIRAEWGRYEAVVNHVMDPFPLSVLCTYDTRVIPQDALAYGRLTHPLIVSQGAHTRNAAYLDPADYLRRTTRAVPDLLEATKPDLAVDNLTSLTGLRDQLKGALSEHPYAAGPAADFVLAVHEVAASAIRHGRPPVHVRVWLTRGRLMANITDHGHGLTDPFAGYTCPGPPHQALTRGMGLWLARRLCPQLYLYETTAGFTVRLTTRLDQHRCTHQARAGTR